MKYNMIISLILVAIIISYLLCVANVVEGYESLTSCLEQGYPHKFCLQVPVQSVIHDRYKLWKRKFKTV